MSTFTTVRPSGGNDRGGASLMLGLIGSGIERSLTPAMHVAEAREQRLDLCYRLIDLDRYGVGLEMLPALLKAAPLLGYSGFNVTYPCKQAIVPMLDELAPEARVIGAVNTVVLREGRWIGYNTDCLGWAWGLRQRHPGADFSRVLLLGAGGAGSAIAHALLQLGCLHLDIADIDRSRAEQLAASMRGAGVATVEVVDDLARAVANCRGLVQATPIGMDKCPGLPLPPEYLHPGLWLAESIYFPIETALVRAARERGCVVIDGGAMAVGQAVFAFELFSGLKADADRLNAQFRRLLATRDRAEGSAKHPTACTSAV